MNFNEIWNQLLKKEPRLEEDDFKVGFKSINLKRSLKPYNPFDDIFGKFQ